MPAGERIGSIGTSRSTDREPGFDTARVLPPGAAAPTWSRAMSVPRPSEGQPMFVRPSRRIAPVLLASILLVGVTLPGAASAAPVADPAGAALDWIEGELAADGGYLTTSY